MTPTRYYIQRDLAYDTLLWIDNASMWANAAMDYTRRMKQYRDHKNDLE